jgi:streptogramin lyase
MSHIGTGAILIVLLAASFLFVGVLKTEPAYPLQSIFIPNSPSANPYVTMFTISQNSSDFIPWVLYPASSNTVWVATIKSGNTIGNQALPPKAQIVNFTVGAKPHPVYNFTAIPSDISYDQKRNRVWFLEDDNLAYYDATSGQTIMEHSFPGGSPQFMVNSTDGRIWITLLGSNQIVAYDPSGIVSPQFFEAPKAGASLQGITTGPDHTIWFAETSAKRIGHIIPCQSLPCNVTDYGPPHGIDITLPIQLAVDRQGTVWFTDHGGSQFGSFNPSTGEWRVFGIGYCSETYNPDCAVGLPNAMALDSNGMIWFSEHFAGRVAKYDPATQSLTEYFVPATTLPYVWWMRPGPGDLVWFTAFGIGKIGYVNASLPIPISINAGVGTVKVEQGTSQSIPASISNQAGGPVYLNVSANRHDATFGSPPFLYGFADPSKISPTTNPVMATFRVSASLAADLGERYVTLTAYNNNVAVNAFVTVNVTPTTIPFIFRTSAPYISVGFAFGIGLGSVGLFLIRLPRIVRKDQNREEVGTEPTRVQSR